jgi:mannose-6-phosphate isomerase-like protein (cupin superfamily)
MEPHEGEHLWVFPENKDKLGTGGELQIYMDAESHPEANASFAKFTLGVGGALQVHRHDKTEELTYFLSGVGVVVTVDGDGNEVEMPVSSGFVWYNPPGVWHAVKNTGTTPLSMVFATIPNDKKGLLSFFRRVCVGPGKEGLHISEEELQRLGREHDLIFRASKADLK